MEYERLKQVRDIFLGAVERPPAERPAFLDQVCDGDASLLSDVTSLLGAFDQLEAPADGRASGAERQAPPLARGLRRPPPIPPRRAVALMRQVCSAVHAAHVAGVIPRDLKPDNIFLEEGPEGEELVKVLDFGLARLQTLPSTHESLTAADA